MNITHMPSRFYGRNSNHGVVDGDMLYLGTTRGDVIMGKVYNLQTNNKPGFDPLFIYKLRTNSNASSEEMTNKFEISFISYDLYFDVLYLGDVSSNVRFLENVLQIGKISSYEDNLPFFSFFYEPKPNKITTNNLNYNIDLPYFSVNHDVIKDRSIILYDQGKDIIISALDDDDENEEEDKRDNIKNFGEAMAQNK
jgi:hypothetical protein